MKVYCDNDTEDGGWTLEYSYHKLVEPISENNVIPEDIFETATNFNPKDEKFAKKNIKEARYKFLFRFFCMAN